MAEQIIAEKESQVPESEAPPKTSPSATTEMAETDQQLPPSIDSSNSTAAPASKFPNVSFSIWPPTQRTRDAVVNRLIETLSSESVLSKRYGTISRDEAEEHAKRIEEEAFSVAGAAASADDDGIEILQVYSKEISKKMLATVKARSAETAPAPAKEPESKPEDPKEEEDVGSTAPPQSEKTESVDGENAEV